MIRHSTGNAGKDTKRCPHCGFENAVSAWGPLAPGEIRVAHSCNACGSLIILDRPRYRVWCADRFSS